MSLFGRRKSGVDLIDFTKTKTGKPIAKPKEESVAPVVGGFLDFTQNTQPSAHSVSSETPNTFGFLSDFSQIGSQNPTTPDVTARLTNPDTEVSSLKIKIDDLEYKIERLLERLTEMEYKLSRA